MNWQMSLRIKTHQCNGSAIGKQFLYLYRAFAVKLDKVSLNTAVVYAMVIINKETGEKMAKEFFIGL